ncbi:MAG TPA: hypothetical protein VFU88_22285 [Ktedonobacterales bacterium]|nr:hypothetical protein [Ktedonobacterales bacterium]
MLVDETLRSLRRRAIGALITVICATLAALLAAAYPRFGISRSFRGFFYIPPQAYLAALLCPLSFVLSIATIAAGLDHSRRVRQRGWRAVFNVLLVLQVLGPGFLMCSVALGWSGTLVIGLPAESWWLLAAGSAIVIALTAVCGLVYLRQQVLAARRAAASWDT